MELSKHSKSQCAIEWFLREYIFPRKRTLPRKYFKKHAVKISGYGSVFSPTGVLFPWVISTGEVLIH